jgi:hypothetical protein
MKHGSVRDSFKKMNTDEENVSNESKNGKKESLSLKLSKNLKEWTADFTMHGFPRIVASNNRVKAFIWTLITLGFLAYCIYCKLS